MGASQPGQQPDMNKIFSAEAENLQMIDHNSKFLDAAEERVLKARAGVARLKRD